MTPWQSWPAGRGVHSRGDQAECVPWKRKLVAEKQIRSVGAQRPDHALYGSTASETSNAAIWACKRVGERPRPRGGEAWG